MNKIVLNTIYVVCILLWSKLEAGNLITMIPSETGFLTSLSHLGLGKYNQLFNASLQLWSESIILTKHLWMIYTIYVVCIKLCSKSKGGNNITNIPSEIGLLTSLIYLDLGKWNWVFNASLQIWSEYTFYNRIFLNLLHNQCCFL